MQQLIHLLLLACAVLGEDAVPLSPPPENLTRSVVSSGPGHEVSERVLSGRKWASLSTFSSRLSASGTTTKTGLAGFSLVAAGAVSGAMLNDMDEADAGVDLSDDNWKEAAWEMTKAAIQLGADIASEMKGVSPLLSSGVGAVIAVADIFIPTDEPLTTEEGQKMINEALEKAKEQWMQEMRDETVGLIQDVILQCTAIAVLAAAFRVSSSGFECTIAYRLYPCCAQSERVPRFLSLPDMCNFGESLECSAQPQMLCHACRLAQRFRNFLADACSIPVLEVVDAALQPQER